MVSQSYSYSVSMLFLFFRTVVHCFVTYTSHGVSVLQLQSLSVVFIFQDSCSLFCNLYKSWCHSPIATVSLCFLSQNYHHACQLLQMLYPFIVIVPAKSIINNNARRLTQDTSQKVRPCKILMTLTVSFLFVIYSHGSNVFPF